MGHIPHRVPRSTICGGLRQEMPAVDTGTPVVNVRRGELGVRPLPALIHRMSRFRVLAFRNQAIGIKIACSIDMESASL